MDTEYLKIRSRAINRAERRAQHRSRTDGLAVPQNEKPGKETIYTIGTKTAREEDLPKDIQRELAADISHRLEMIYPEMSIPIFIQT